MPSPQEAVAVAYERCSFTRGSGFDWEKSGVLDMWLLTSGGCTLHGGSTAADIYMARVSFRHSALSGTLSNNNHHQSEVLVSIVSRHVYPAKSLRRTVKCWMGAGV